MIPNPCEYCSPYRLDPCKCDPCICREYQEDELDRYWSIERDSYLFSKVTK